MRSRDKLKLSDFPYHNDYGHQTCSLAEGSLKAHQSYLTSRWSHDKLIKLYLHFHKTSDH